MITVMDLQLIFFFLTFLHGIYGQLNVPPSTDEVRGEDVLLVCTSGEATPIFTWADVTDGQSLYTGPTRATSLPKYINIWLQEGTDVQTSILNISAIEIEDHGEYRCSTTATTTLPPATVVTVEVNSTRSLSVESTIESNIDMYVATCDALGGRPDETITWMLGDGLSPCGNPVETNPTAEPGLSSKTSVCKFRATIDNNGQTLKCDISGHQIQDLNVVETTTLNIHSEPSAGILMVRFEFLDPSLRVSCDIDVANQPKPNTRNYYIYSNDTLIHQSSTEDNDVEVLESEFDLYTEFKCVAGNYLGNVTSNATRYDPTRPTIPPTTGTSGLGPGAYAGIAIGVIACIVIIVVIVLYLLKPECCPCFAGSGIKSSGSSKPAGSAVGSSNGSEREKTKPEAAPRGHGSIQHTNDNPNQDMYAMVDKKPSGGRGGDAPDRGSGPGQNEPQGMLYADLDLSHKAGHTDKHVPKNENDVVVYSSILV